MSKKGINSVHGDSRTRLHVAWTKMIDRCTRACGHSYNVYGEVGITVYGGYMSLLELLPKEEIRETVAIHLEWAKAEAEKEKLRKERANQSLETRQKNAAEKKKAKVLAAAKELGLNVSE